MAGIPMRLRNPFVFTAGFALVAALLTILAQTPAQAATTPLGDCPVSPTTPCVMSVQRDSVDISAPYGYIGWYGNLSGSKDIYFSAEYNGGADLGASERSTSWRVVIFVGDWAIPNVTHGKGQNVKVTRGHTADGYTVTITANPVLLSGQCISSTYCPEHWVPTTPSDNNVQWDGYFDLYITDYGAWSDASQRADFFGMNYFNNIAYTELPPQIVFPADPSLPPYLLVNTANRRFLDDETTLVNGHVEMRIPNRFLSGVYGVPDPSTMTSSGVVVTGDGTERPSTSSRKPVRTRWWSTSTACASRTSPGPRPRLSRDHSQPPPRGSRPPRSHSAT